MNKKKIILVVIFFLLVIGGLVYFKLQEETNNVNETEITPLEEITEEQERETMISLYFKNPETNTLVPEARKIDVKELIENPYKTLVELIIESPKNEKLESSVPEGTKINSAVIENGVVKIDLSSEFIENQKGDKVQAELSVYAIVNTLTELNEVNSIKILINGEENKKFNEIDFSLEGEFVRQE